MTLNDNQLVDAERRLKIYTERRNKLSRYSSSRISIERDETGLPTKMYINPYIKSGKASKLIDRLNKEISKAQKIIKSFT